MVGQETSVTLTPLGGLGEIGMNCMLLESDDSIIVIDCGLMFPSDYHYGVDILIPRFETLLAKKDKIRGIILTHGHEDHIGALPWLLPYVDVPVYSSSFTLALLENKLREHNLNKYVDLRQVSSGDQVELGPFTVHFIPVCHSIINGFGLGIETPVGRIIHSGDFKIDPTPMDNQFTDLDAFAAFSEPGVHLLLSDSTNIEREGVTLTEMEIKAALERIFRQAEGRIIITLFSSHIQRMQEVFDLAAMTGRKVAVSGRSLVNNIGLARELGYLRAAPDATCSLENIDDMRDDKLVLLVTGSQGEPLSVLTRIAQGDHRQIKIHKGDLVLMSSRIIPGNTKAISRVINNLYRLGAEVLYEKVQGIHASGHAHREELATMLNTVKPKFFVPIHGEYRHLVKHCQLARECGVASERAIVLDNGQPLTFFERGIRFEDRIRVDSTFVDGKGVGDVGASVLKERKLLAEEGLVVVHLVIDQETGHILVGPEMITKGFVFEQQFEHVLDDSKCLILDVFESNPKASPKKNAERIRIVLRSFFRKVLQRDPVVLPVVVGV
ncbi:ribonuclease J [Desulfonatronum thiosulfatophilum]|uniref:Ribonuclease J n=1 Tax=Desulfonatronum thiosulfatophilum TaxID=617002 RepID=A0A1G6E2S6_9BACT|nr:ribonuclease J [Desulfonatronum thiosulfatophilum]SDB51749.1 ribonuclease J [Desulfonatronum thiosulfatophilum]